MSREKGNIQHGVSAGCDEPADRIPPFPGQQLPGNSPLPLVLSWSCPERGAGRQSRVLTPNKILLRSNLKGKDEGNAAPRARASPAAPALLGADRDQK